MNIISREEFPEEHQKASNEEKMTPWQLANLEYLKQKALEDEKAAVSEPELAESDSAEAASAEDSPEETPSSEVSPEEEEADQGEEQSEPNEPAPTLEGPKYGSFLDRLPNIKHERNRRLVRRSTILILLFSLPALLLLYYISPLGKLGAVEVTGNSQVATETIENDLGFTVGDNLWSQYFQRDDKIKKLKKQEMQVQEATVQITHFNHFKVTIKEYPEVAYLESNGNYSPVISNGKVVPIKVEKSNGELPILESFTNSKRILKVLEQYEQLSEEVKQGISQIKYAPTTENNELLEIYMNDGNKVLISSNQLASKMNYYPQIAKEMSDQGMKGVVDMEAGIYSYPYAEDTATEESTQATTNQSETPVGND